MNSPEAVRTLGALAHEARLAVFKLLVQAGRDAFRRDSHSQYVVGWAPPVVTTPTLPPPTLADAAAAELDVAADRSGVNRRLTVGVTVLAGLCCAAVATVYGLL